MAEVVRIPARRHAANQCAVRIDAFMCEHRGFGGGQLQRYEPATSSAIEQVLQNCTSDELALAEFDEPGKLARWE